MSAHIKKQCRFCDSPLEKTFVDLGMTPLSNANLKEDQLFGPETYLPLHVFVCSECYLVQLPEMQTPDKIFDDDYAYFSSYSESWLKHAKAYVDKMSVLLNLTKDSKVVELASNDGYLLQYFVEKGIPVLGVEPSSNCAKVAIEKNVPTEIKFFGEKTALELKTQGHDADLILGNNVLAHVPDINDFVSGISTLMKPDGTCTIEFPHLLQLIENSQFDTVYHEHYSYLSLFVVEKIFARHGMTVFDVEELSTHGGSLRIFARHQDDTRPVTGRLISLRQREFDYGLNKMEIYEKFPQQTLKRKNGFLKFLIGAKEEGKSVSAYGAAAKGNTFLNFCGVGREYIDFVVDRSPQKQNRYLPGTHIPILDPEALKKSKPDYIVILPWNLKSELTEQLSYTREWGAKLVVAIPDLEVF